MALLPSQGSQRPSNFTSAISIWTLNLSLSLGTILLASATAKTWLSCIEILPGGRGVYQGRCVKRSRQKDKRMCVRGCFPRDSGKNTTKSSVSHSLLRRPFVKSFSWQNWGLLELGDPSRITSWKVSRKVGSAIHLDVKKLDPICQWECGKASAGFWVLQ